LPYREAMRRVTTTYKSQKRPDDLALYWVAPRARLRRKWKAAPPQSPRTVASPMQKPEGSDRLLRLPAHECLRRTTRVVRAAGTRPSSTESHRPEVTSDAATNCAGTIARTHRIMPKPGGAGAPMEMGKNEKRAPARPTKSSDAKTREPEPARRIARRNEATRHLTRDDVRPTTMPGGSGESRAPARGAKAANPATPQAGLRGSATRPGKRLAQGKTRPP